MKRVVNADYYNNLIHFFEDRRTLEQLERGEVAHTLCGMEMYSGYGVAGWRAPNSDDLDKLECVECHHLYYNNPKEGE